MGALKSMFSGPKVAPTRRMPDAQDPAAMAAEAEMRRKKMATGGRESTNMSGQGGYAETILGN